MADGPGSGTSFAASSGSPLSPIVAQAIERCVEVSDALLEVHPSHCRPTARDQLTVKYLSIAFDHREAILLLLQHGARTSAYALFRCAFEACFRGIWAQYAASDQQIASIEQRGIAPGFDNCVRQLSRAKSAAFGKNKILTWEAFSDFAHTGARQLSRWECPDGIAPSHPDEDLPGMLLLLDLYAVLSCIGIHDAAGSDAGAVTGVWDRLIRPRVAELREHRSQQAS